MTTDKDVAESIHRLGQLALRIADERGILVKALAQIRALAVSPYASADPRWQTVEKIATTALEACQ